VIVDQKQQRQVNEAGDEFADVLKESYQSIADRSVSAQESVNSYMDCPDSMFSYYRGNLDEVQRRANQ
jgi:flagellar hook-basal body complex protein FliE